MSKIIRPTQLTSAPLIIDSPRFSKNLLHECRMRLIETHRPDKWHDKCGSADELADMLIDSS